MSKGQKRPYEQVMPIAQHIVEALRPFCENGRIEIAGSLRRGRQMVGDIEICAIPKRPYKLQRSLFQPKEVDFDAQTELGKFLKSKLKEKYWRLDGQKLKSFYYSGIQVDLFLPTLENWGWRFMLSTGSGDFNKWLVTSQAKGGAMPWGKRSDDGYLWHRTERLVTQTEEDVFTALDLPFIPVDYRDDHHWLKLVGEGE